MAHRVLTLHSLVAMLELAGCAARASVLMVPASVVAVLGVTAFPSWAGYEVPHPLRDDATRFTG